MADSRVKRGIAAAAAAVALAVGGYGVGHTTTATTPTPDCPTVLVSVSQGGCTADSPIPPQGEGIPGESLIAPPPLTHSYPNGQIPDSALCPITGGVGPAPGGQLLCGGTAASWNAMAVYIHAKTGVWLSSDGNASAYRTYAQQVTLRNYWCNLGKCQNAAVPGTSNHGWGTAVDNPNYTLIRTYGGQFHWGIGYGSCSDAPWENWHAHYCGGYSGKDPGPYGSGSGQHSFRVIKLGDGGPRVFQLNCRLRHLNNVPGHKAYTHHRTRHYGKGMKRAVIHFQHDHKLGADGVYGDKTNSKMKHRFKRYEKVHGAACHR